MSTLLSTAVRDITPAAGFPMGGYGVDEPRRAVGTRRPLTTRCIVLRFDGDPYAIVTVDVLGFGPRLHAEIRARAAARGVFGGRYVLTATHTHSGPALPEILDPCAAYNLTDPTELNRYAETLVDQVDAALADALAAPTVEVALSYRTAAAGFSYNREGLAHDETEVPVLVAADTAGAPRAILFGYGAHPVAAGVQTRWDPDYPGVAIDQLERALPGVHAQFLLGPAGDQNPRIKRDFAAADDYGRELAAVVAAAVSDPGTPVDGPPAWTLQRPRLPFDVTDTGTAIAAYRERAADESVPGFKRRHAAQQAGALAVGTAAHEIPLPVQAWRFDGLRIIFCGGEVASGFAERARAAADGPLWFAGYAGEVPGYIPSDDLLDHACYAGARDADHPVLAGGSGTVYDYPFPLRRSPDGVQDRLDAVLAELAHD